MANKENNTTAIAGFETVTEAIFGTFQNEVNLLQGRNYEVMFLYCRSLLFLNTL